MLPDPASTVPSSVNTCATSSPPTPNVLGSASCRASTARSSTRLRARPSAVRCSERSRVSSRRTEPSTSAAPDTSVVITVMRVRTDLSAARSATIGLQAVADASHRRERRAAERLVDPQSQLMDVDLDDVGVAVEREVPDVVEDAALREHLTRVPHEVLEQ